MAYISASGDLGGSGPGWSIYRIPDMFWGFVNCIMLFFQTLMNPQLTGKGGSYTSDYRSPGRGPPPFPPRRRFGGISRMGGPSAPPMSGGG